MPLINYACGCGEIQKKYFQSAKDVPSVLKCKCGLEAKKAFGATSSSHLITIDNGLQARRLEVRENIMEINDERSAKDYTEE
jgi:hypothetical protein